MISFYWLLSIDNYHECVNKKNYVIVKIQK